MTFEVWMGERGVCILDLGLGRAGMSLYGMSPPLTFELLIVIGKFLHLLSRV